MSKVALGLVGAVVVAGAISPVVVGTITHSKLEQLVDKVAAIPGYEAELVEYNQGYLTATAVYKVGFDSDVLASEQELDALQTWMQEGATFDLDIQHGPLFLSDGLELGLTKAKVAFADDVPAVQEWHKTLGVEQLFSSHIFMGFTGQGYVHSDVAAFTYEEQSSGEKINFGGAQLQYKLFGYGTTYDATGEVGQITIDSEEGLFEVAPMTLTAKGEIPDQMMLATGDMTFNMPSMTFKQNDTLMLETKDLVLAVNMYDADDTEALNIDYRIDMASMLAEQRTLQNFVLDVAVESLSKEALVDYSELVNQYAVGEIDDTAMQAALMPLGQQFLAKGPEFKLKQLSFDLDAERSMKLSTQVGLDSAAASLLQGDFIPMQLIPFIMADLKLDASNAMAEEILTQYAAHQVEQAQVQAQMEAQAALAADPEATPVEPAPLPTVEEAMAQYRAMKDQFVGAGYLVEDEAGLHIEASFKQAQLTVNGNPIPLGM